MDNEYEQELREQAEYGRKAKIAQEFFKDFIQAQQTQVISQLETQAIERAEDFYPQIVFLRTLKYFERTVQMYIDMGEIAEKELNENGSN